MSLVTAREVLRHEANSILRMRDRLDRSFNRAVSLIQNTRGRVVILGMGKPGFIAQKISASLASTGVPSIALHAADALHGDIGRVTPKDIVMILSNSGETEEIMRLLPVIKAIGCSLIALTGNVKSNLARSCDVNLDVSIEREAGPLDVVPTASTTCMLAMGDAITMTLIKKRAFKTRDFAFLHPGGALGRKLHTTVAMVMRTGTMNPCVRPSASVRQALLKVTSARAGSANIVDSKNRLVGIFTDGDLRRQFKVLIQDTSQPVSKFMTPHPITIGPHELASNALEIMRKRKIDELPVIDRKKRVVGLLDVQDLLNKGFVI